MRVLLINPWDAEVFPTPSIGYLQATLKANSVDVTAVDLSGAFKSTDYDLVAVTFHSFSVKHAEKIRKYYKGRLICGGHHPSALPDQMLKIGYDQVIIGEGEQAIIDVIEGNISPKVRGKISDIDSLPYPDYTGLGFWNTMGMPIITSRGCPFDCSFCASSHFWDRKYRARSADNVLNEISWRVQNGLKTWMFEDDNFTANKSRAIDICAGIGEMGKFTWQCASRAESLDETLCKALNSAGCKTVWLGVESLSQPSLDRCKKRTTVEKMLQGIEIAEGMGLETMSQFLIGIPGDSVDNINETVENIMRSKIKRKGTNIVWILPGTDIYDKAKEKGFNDDVYLKSGAPFYTYEQNMDVL
jgi:radical SAM superfamily enzyme YgiQ (UPF0313 family)